MEQTTEMNLTSIINHLDGIDDGCVEVVGNEERAKMALSAIVKHMIGATDLTAEEKHIQWMVFSSSTTRSETQEAEANLATHTTSDVDGWQVCSCCRAVGTELEEVQCTKVDHLSGI